MFTNPLRNTFPRDNVDGLDNSSRTSAIGISKKVTCSWKVNDRVGFHERNGLGQRELLVPCRDSVAAVESGREGGRGGKSGEVLAFQCGAVDTNDKLQQVDVANQRMPQVGQAA